MNNERQPPIGKVLILVRHGESVANVSGILSSGLDRYPLTNEGRMQVERVAAKIENIEVDNFYTSPVLRALETSEIISEHTGIRPEVNPLLVERNFGKLEEWNFGTRAALERQNIMQIENNYPDMEPWKSIEARMERFVGGTKDGVSLAVTHMDPIKALLSLILERDEAEMRGVNPGNASITAIDLRKKGFDSVLCIGSHFLPKALLKDSVK